MIGPYFIEENLSNLVLFLLAFLKVSYFKNNNRNVNFYVILFNLKRNSTAKQLFINCFFCISFIYLNGILPFTETFRSNSMQRDVIVVTV